MRLRNSLVVALTVAVVLAAPVAAADVSIAGGNVIVYEGNDPGVAVPAAETVARHESDPGCYEGLTCLFAGGEVLGERWSLIVGGGEGCYGVPSECLVVGLVSNATVLYVQSVREGGGPLITCYVLPTNSSAYACYGIAANSTLDPSTIVLCAGAGETRDPRAFEDVTCDGLLIDSEAPCIRRASDGFDIVCVS